MAPRRSSRVAAAASAASVPVQQNATPAKKEATPAKKTVSPNKATGPGSNKVKKGLAGTLAPDSSKALGRVDPASKLTGDIFVDDDGAVYECMLNLVDVSKNSDKYYILQVVKQTNGKFVVFNRWGRTGTAGSCAKVTCADEVAAVEEFSKKFVQKTGWEWEDRQTYIHVQSKYLWVQVNHQQDAQMWDEKARWQYWVDDGVDGKADGWYDYTEDGSLVVEQLHHEWSFNSQLCKRVVHSGTWLYLVNLSKMTQTNIQHANRTRRHIRRWTPALGNDATPPGELDEESEFHQADEEMGEASDAEDGDGAVTQATQGTASVVAPPTPNPKTPMKRKRAAAPPTPCSKPAKPQLPVVIKTEPMQYSVDSLCVPKLPAAVVHEDYTCMLNQTNVGANNNKYYRIQLLTDANGSKFWVWTRWGRVGENGQNNLAGAFDEAAAISAFNSKFKSKTGNNWDDRATFVHKNGKYDLVILDEEADDQEALLEGASIKKPKAEPGLKSPPSTLDPTTQKLISLIFSEDMFNAAMQDFDIDVKKMPLGNLSQTQVQKGYDVLAELKTALANGDRREVEQQTSRFYTVIPHNFGRQRPTLIDTAEKLQAKFEMCDVLSDIETAQGMLKDVDEDAPALAQHPLDEKYATLQATLDLLPKSDPAYDLIRTYFENTTSSWNKVQLTNVWAVDGQKDGNEFKKSAKLDNHRLLWHGTNVAVVAAILKGGLRIMPHSGGRVGKGIYLASEHSKSACYVRPSQNTGIMFLVEAALGKVHTIQKDDCSLNAAPKGFDSILAKGRTEPDPTKDASLTLGNCNVVVPQGTPVSVQEAASSYFSQSEYLVYRENQQRLRYILTFKW